MGRTSYLEMSSYWPHSDDEYAAPMNNIPKVVFSKTLSDAEASWPVTRVARGDLATEIAAIKAEPGPDVIVWGGPRFAGALAGGSDRRVPPHGPTVGAGHRPGLVRPTTGLEAPHLVEALSVPSGIVLHTYRPQHS